jgi:hypothetical protein
MPASGDRRLDAIFRAQAPAAGADGPSGPAETDDLGPCASRPMPGGWMGLIVLNGRENTRAFQYVHMGHEEFAVDGQWFVFEFNVGVSEKWRLRVRGRNLWPIFVNIHHHKIEWIKKADRDFDEDKPMITAIAIEPVAENEKAAAKSRPLLEDHAHVVEARDEATAVDLLAAAGAVAETDDVGA